MSPRKSSTGKAVRIQDDRGRASYGAGARWSQLQVAGSTSPLGVDPATRQIAGIAIDDSWFWGRGGKSKAGARPGLETSFQIMGVDPVSLQEVRDEPTALTDLTDQHNLPAPGQVLPLEGDAPDRDMDRALHMSGCVLLGFADVDEQRVTEQLVSLKGKHQRVILLLR
jgi:hypothetical protein